MPLFEYECKKCSHKFEELVSSGQTEIACPQCGSTDTRKLISVFARSAAGAASAPSCYRPGCGGSGFG